MNLKNFLYLIASIIYATVVVSIFLRYEQSLRTHLWVRDWIPWLVMAPFILFVGKKLLTFGMKVWISPEAPVVGYKSTQSAVRWLPGKPAAPVTTQEVIFRTGEEYIAFFFAADKINVEEIAINYSGKHGEMLVEWKKDVHWIASNLGTIIDSGRYIKGSRYQEMRPTTHDFSEIRLLMSRVNMDAKHCAIIESLIK